MSNKSDAVKNLFAAICLYTATFTPAVIGAGGLVASSVTGGIFGHDFKITSAEIDEAINNIKSNEIFIETRDNDIETLTVSHDQDLVSDALFDQTMDYIDSDRYVLEFSKSFVEEYMKYNSGAEQEFKILSEVSTILETEYSPKAAETYKPLYDFCVNYKDNVDQSKIDKGVVGISVISGVISIASLLEGVVLIHNQLDDSCLTWAKTLMNRYRYFMNEYKKEEKKEKKGLEK